MFWPYHDTIFANQRGENAGAFSSTALKNFATAIGLNENEFNECLDSGKYSQTVRTETTEGQERGVQSTPTIFINGEQFDGALPFSQLQAFIEAETSD